MMNASEGRGFPLKSGIPGVGLVWRDVKRTIRGASAFAHYLMTRERIEVGLGRLATDASAVALGQPSRYSIRIANVGEKAWEGRVVIDITAMQASDPLESRYATFAKRLMVTSCSAMALEIEYDWLAQAIFMIDGHASPPDEFRQGRAAKVAGWWAVHALLEDLQGARVDELTIYQGMKG